MTVYTLKKKKDTSELHLFEGEITGEDKCNSKNQSICKEMNKPESEDKNSFTCLNEEEARIECARIGRKVCGVCVSKLYTTYKKP